MKLNLINSNVHARIAATSAIPKSVNYKVVDKVTNKILFEGNKADMLRKVKELNRQGAPAYLGVSSSKKIGDKFK